MEDFTHICYLIRPMKLVLCWIFFSSTLSFAQWSIESGNRPEAVQKQIKKEFKHLKNLPGSFQWNYNGNITYPLMGLDIPQILSWILDHRRAGSQTLRILDFGSGDFSWVIKTAKDLAPLVQGQPIQIHLYGVTGEIQPVEDRLDIVETQEVKIHLHEQVPLEDIDTYFPADLHFDLIVSNWAINHMVDPMGVLKRLYDLLEPHGTLMSDLFSLGDRDLYVGKVLSRSQIPFLTTTATGRGEPGLMIVKESRSFDIPLSYDPTRPLKDSGEHGLPRGIHAASTLARYLLESVPYTPGIYQFNLDIAGGDIGNYSGTNRLFEQFLPYLEKSQIAIRVRESGIELGAPLAPGPKIHYTIRDKNLKWTENLPFHYFPWAVNPISK